MMILILTFSGRRPQRRITQMKKDIIRVLTDRKTETASYVPRPHPTKCKQYHKRCWVSCEKEVRNEEKYNVKRHLF
jgi:hypothetical protein